MGALSPIMECPSVTEAEMPICVAALYQFTRFDDPAQVQAGLEPLLLSLGIKGTLLIAREGINGTVAGTDDAIAALLVHIRTLPGCAGIDVKLSRAPDLPFHRTKVKLKREIVTMGQPDIDPLADVGHYVMPEDWNALISSPDVIVIDTRNDYEVAVGQFHGAIDPKTASFRDFPGWFRSERERLLGEGKPARVAMYCTGGIRCEKSTAFLKAEGVEDVYHLKGGILNYLEHVPADQSLWEGECFVFDQRVTVTHDLEPGSYAVCHACRLPVSQEEQASPLYEAGVSCPACHGTKTEAQRASYAERQRQEDLALSRGTTHVGATRKQGDPEAE
ncbi:oxygen-dependent tRNA uridine(34) hydroxylase TrhO [Croceibacterium xixiisoli]|nr:rhodanese-related sulfurtransferase [Croceibacterium xixiisoli]